MCTAIYDFWSRNVHLYTYICTLCVYKVFLATPVGNSR